MKEAGILLALLTVLSPAGYAQIYAENLPIDHPAIRYFEGPLDDPVARLGSRKVRLEFRAGGLGYLPSLLEHLGVNPDSQALVFSKTSFQAARISPRNPRAIYFNDEVAVGFVPGGDGYEVAAVDPRQGVIFYSLVARETDQPRSTRREECLHCHQGAATLGVPGFFIGSVYPNASGMPARLGAIITDNRTAFADRWGGWYVDGTHGSQRHKGNAVASDPAEPQSLGPLAMRFDKSGYLTPVSDIVALMTFEHQTQMTNFITRVGWDARMGSSQLDADIEAMVAYMLFAEEAPLAEPVRGVSTFTETFPRRGPRDRQGRSLRDFDLKTRLFRYPLSYMVYSAAFDALPEDVLARVYRRIYDAKIGGRTAGERKAIVEILRDTKGNLPPYWR